MVVFRLRKYFRSRVEMELDVQRVLRALVLLEGLQLLRLPHPAGQDSPHAPHARLAQLGRLAPVVINSPKERPLSESNFNN